MPRWRWVLRQFTRRLWVRATLIGILGVVTAILAAVVERYIPWELPTTIGADAVDSILNIIASSMLAVTTFSLSVMTSAYGSATSNVTPRATKLLMEDRVTQNVLSAFIGSFLFSVVGIVVLKTGAYGDRGRTVLFFVTICVIALIVVSLLRWIDYLTRLGRVGETTDRVETVAEEAIETRARYPYLGGVPDDMSVQDLEMSAEPVRGDVIGYVQHIDTSALSSCCETHDVDIHVTVNPGAFVYPHTPLAWVRPGPGDDDRETVEAAVRGAFSIGDERNFDHDPRFGLAVMSEIASRALSPAINDAGTAIDVIGRNTRLLALWSKVSAEAEVETQFPRVHVAPIAIADLFEDAFMVVARDGAGMVEVQLRLQKALTALSHMGDEAFRKAAAYQAELALERARANLPLERDVLRLREASVLK